MTRIINLNGEHGVGKSTVAQYLHNALIATGANVKILHLADPVKKMCAILAGENIINYHSEAKDEFCKQLGINRRQLMVDMTAVCRDKFCKDVFWNLGTANIAAYDVIIVGDARYADWYEYLNRKQYEVFNIYVSREGKTHGEATIRYHKRINNNFSLEELKSTCLNLATTLIIK